MSGSKPPEDNLKRFRKHIVLCPECSAENLDHMTVCRSCGATLKPKGYQPLMAKETAKRIKTILTVILSVAAIVVVLLWFTTKNGLI